MKMDTINGQETNRKTTYSLVFYNNQSIIFKKERIFTFVMPFLNAYFIISMKFLPKNLSRKFFRLKSIELSTKYRYRRYFFKTVPLSVPSLLFLAKYLYRYRRFF